VGELDAPKERASYFKDLFINGKKLKDILIPHISFDDLYVNANSFKLTIDYLLLCFLAGMLATLGLIANNTAVVVGSMIVSPFLKPIISAAFSINVGDFDLFKKSVVGIILGLTTVIFFSIIVTLFFPWATITNEILTRTNPTLIDISIALAAGIAAAFAFTSKFDESLVGVAVAAAFLPPASTAGILLALYFSGQVALLLSLNALLLMIINLITMSFAAMVIFWLRGIRPRWTTNERKALSIFNNAIKYTFFLIIIFSIPITYLTLNTISNTTIETYSKTQTIDSFTNAGLKIETFELINSNNLITINVTAYSEQETLFFDNKSLEKTLTSEFNIPFKINVTLIKVKNF
ncbi:MAG: TIGR00341 family protein, partial [Candidatus Diapherotrites archaeon]|nr:TIGR00341 family protein [Candidatus Diapherotrites archaeon]